MSALDTQVGGGHYCKLKVQPAELTYKLGASPVFMLVAKYFRDKECPIKDLKKSLHGMQLEVEFKGYRDKYYNNCVQGYSEMIKEFAMQFEYPSVVFHVLEDFYLGNYQIASDTLERYIKIVDN